MGTQRTLTSPNHPTVRSMSHLTVATLRRNMDTSMSHLTVATTRRNTDKSTSPRRPTVRSTSHLMVATTRRNTDTSTSPRYTRPIRTTLMGIRAIEVSPTTTLPNANYI